MGLVIVLAIAIIILVVAIKGYGQRKRKRQENAWTSACNDPKVQEIVDTLAGDVLPTVPAPIALERGESCYFYAPVQYHEMRTVTTRVNYSGVTSRVRIMKGTYLRAGSFVPNRITAENIVRLDTGTLYFTNNRLIFMGKKRNLTLTRKTVLAVNPYRDAIEVEKTAGRSPIFRPAALTCPSA